MCFGEGREETEWEQEIGDAASACWRDGVFDDVAIGGTLTGDSACDQARMICYCCSGIRYLHGTAVCHGFK